MQAHNIECSGNPSIWRQPWLSSLHVRRLRYNGKHAGTPRKDTRECYRRVEECRRLAGTAMSELARFDYLEMEQRWLSLAHSYTSSERLTAITGAKPRGRKRG